MIKRFKKGAAAILAGVLALSALPISVMADESLVESVTAQLEENKDSFITIYDQVLAQIGAGQAAAETQDVTQNVKLSIEPGEALLSLAGLLGLDLSWLQSIALGAEVVLKDGAVYVPMELGLNDTGIISAEMLMNTEDGSFFVSSPDLFDGWVHGSPEVLAGNAGTGEAAATTALNTADIIKALPSGETLFNIIEKYACIAVGRGTSAPISEALTAGDVTEQLDGLEIVYNTEDIQEVTTEILTELQNDEEIKSILDKFSAFTDGRDLFAEMNEKCAEFQEQAVSGDGTDDITIDIKHFKSEEKHSGFILSLTSNGETTEVACYRVADGDNHGYKFSVAGGGSVITLEGSGSSDAAGHENGNLVLSLNGEPTVNIDFTDAFIDQESQTYGVNFTVSMISQPAAEDDDEYADANPLSMLQGFELTLSCSGDQQNAELALSVSAAGTEYGTIRITSAPSEAIEFPDIINSDVPVYEMTSEEDMNAVGSTFTLDKIFSNLSAAGVPDEFISQIMSMFTGGADTEASSGFGEDEEYDFEIDDVDDTTEPAA